MLKTIIKIALTIIGAGVLCCISYLVFIMYAIGVFDRDYSVTDLKNGFEENKTAIYEVKRYFDSIVPKDRSVEIEFDSDNELERFGIVYNDSIGHITNYLEWHVPVASERTDSIIALLGWTRTTLHTLKQKLDDADCIQIENGEPTRIGYKRSGMVMYFFNVFARPVSKKQRKTYNDTCSYILVNDTLAIEMAGGAIGQQCFYKME